MANDIKREESEQQGPIDHQVGRRNFMSYVAKGALAGAALAASGALSACGEDDPDPIENEDEIEWDETTDVVIMGGGGAGLVAAIVAREAGAEVVVIEKNDVLGGTTALSGGQVQASGTSYQQAAGVSGDTPERHAEYWLKASENVADPEIIELLANEAPNSIKFMEDHGLQYAGVYGVSHMPQVEPDLMVPRIHIPMADAENVLSGGARHVDVLRTSAEDLETDIRMESTVDALIVNDEGVAGVRATIGGEEKYIKATQGVIIAAGGFDHNTEMCHTYSPQQLWELETGVCYCNPGNVGDGIKLGMAVGADLASGMSGTVGYPGAMIGTADEIPGFWVNVHGQRFVAEDAHYAYKMRQVFSQDDAMAWAVFDQATADLGGEVLGGLFGRWSADLSEEISSGLIKTGETLDDLADALGVHKGQLAETVEMWNADVEGEEGEDTLFGRQVGLSPLGDGPYYAFRVTSVNLGSCGGLRINTNAQVIDVEGEIIPKLYAAGMAAGGFIGTFYPGSGTAVMSTIVLGRVAAAHATSNATTEA